MENQEKDKLDYYVVDISHIIKSLFKHIRLIVFSGLLAAVVGLLISTFMISPTYSSFVKLYVNNISDTKGNTGASISTSELSAAQSLVRTYGDILTSRSTLERVIEKADVEYTWKQLSGMITYEPSNNTEIVKVTVTCKDPYEAFRIANIIAEVLPVRISEIIEGASMKVVDSALLELEKVGPSVFKHTVIGFIIGIFISAIAVVVLALLDDTIHDEEYVLKTYDYPILGKVSNLLSTGNKSHRYYSQKHQRTEN